MGNQRWAKGRQKQLPNIFIRIRIIYKEMDSLFSVHILFLQTKDTDYVLVHAFKTHRE